MVMDMTTANAIREDRPIDRTGAPGPLAFELPTQRSDRPWGPPTPYRTPSPGGPTRPRTPAPAIGDAVYCLLSFVPAVVFFVLTVTLCAVGLGLSMIWIGVPVLALALLTARLGAYLQLAMCAALLDSPMPDPGPPPRRRGGPMGVLAALIGDAANWRAAAYWLLKIVLAPIQFAVVIGCIASPSAASATPCGAAGCHPSRPPTGVGTAGPSSVGTTSSTAGRRC